MKSTDSDHASRRTGIVRTAVVLGVVAVAIYVVFILRATLSA